MSKKRRRNPDLFPWMLICAGMFGMMTIPAHVLNEYAKAKQKAKPKLWPNFTPSPTSERKRKRGKTIVDIEDISDGKL